MICRECNMEMSHVISFDGNEVTDYWRCDKCHHETSPKPFQFKKKDGNQKKKRSQKPSQKNSKREKDART